MSHSKYQIKAICGILWTYSSIQLKQFYNYGVDLSPILLKYEFQVTARGVKC
jgi:hypothetical protein